jgi:hypothetical protein
MSSIILRRPYPRTKARGFSIGLGEYNNHWKTPNSLSKIEVVAPMKYRATMIVITNPTKFS